jgi:hypothetical protein
MDVARLRLAARACGACSSRPPGPTSDAGGSVRQRRQRLAHRLGLLGDARARGDAQQPGAELRLRVVGGDAVAPPISQSASSSSSRTRARSAAPRGRSGGSGWRSSRYSPITVESWSTTSPSKSTGTWPRGFAASSRSGLPTMPAREIASRSSSKTIAFSRSAIRTFADQGEREWVMSCTRPSCSGAREVERDGSGKPAQRARSEPQASGVRAPAQARCAAPTAAGWSSRWIR